MQWFHQYAHAQGTVTGSDVVQERGVGKRRHQKTLYRQLRPVRQMRRLKPHQASRSGGNANGPTPIRCVRHPHHTPGHRCGRATR